MTTSPGQYGALTPSQKADWDRAFPDPTERDAWITHFRANANLAAHFRDQHMDPAPAREWLNAGFTPRVIPFLHHHGYTPPTVDQMRNLLQTGYDTIRGADSDPYLAHYIAALTYAHPTLTAREAFTLAQAHITLDEAHHLITTGTYDRTAITLLTGLT